MRTVVSVVAAAALALGGAFPAGAMPVAASAQVKQAVWQSDLLVEVGRHDRRRARGVRRGGARAGIRGPSRISRGEARRTHRGSARRALRHRGAGAHRRAERPVLQQRQRARGRIQRRAEGNSVRRRDVARSLERQRGVRGHRVDRSRVRRTGRIDRDRLVRRAARNHDVRRHDRRVRVRENRRFRRGEQFHAGKRWHGGPRHWRKGRFYHGYPRWKGPRRVHRGHYWRPAYDGWYYWSNNAWFLAPAFGVVIATTIVADSYAVGYYEPWSDAWFAWCADRYVSFDPRTGHFLGYDGDYHFCVYTG